MLPTYWKSVFVIKNKDESEKNTLGIDFSSVKSDRTVSSF